MSFCRRAWCLGLLFLSACKVGPTYKQPKVKLPDSYKQQGAAGVANLDNWWTFFEDSYLNALIEKARVNNFDLRIALEKIEEARAAYKIQAANVYPEVDATGTINRSGFSQEVLENKFFPQTLSFFQTGFDALWEVDFWGRLRYARDGAYNTFQAQQENAHDVFIILLSDVAKNYIDIRSLQKKIDLLDQKIALDTKLFALTHDRLHAGIDSELPDLDQFATLEESKNQRVILKTTLDQTVNALAILLGENPEAFILQPGKHTVPLSKKKLEVGLPSDLVRRRPDIREAERLLAASTAAVGAAIANWFPKFSLLGAFTSDTNKFSKWFHGDSFSWSIGPSLSCPVLTFGRIEFNVKEKKSIQRQALLTYGQAVVKALGDVENSLIAYFNTDKQVSIINKKLLAITKEGVLTYSLFTSGLDSEREALVAEKNRIDTESELIDLQQSLSSSLIAVYKALGGGW